MKISKIATPLVLGTLALGTGCQKKSTDEPAGPSFDPAITQIAGRGTNPRCYVEKPPGIGQFSNHVINSAAEYNALFNCTPPPVDFNTYTLLIGKTATTNGNYISTQRGRQAYLTYTYSVEIKLSRTAVVQPVVYHALVPKLLPGAPVTFDVPGHFLSVQPPAASSRCAG